MNQKVLLLLVILLNAVSAQPMISSNPQQGYQQVSTQELPECPICCEDIILDKNGESTEFILPGCSMHGFHEKCVAEWLQKHTTCPCCMQDLHKTNQEWLKNFRIKHRPAQEDKMLECDGNNDYMIDIEEPELICTICLCEVQTSDNFLRLECQNHVFHRACIGPWLANHSTCPNCRHQMSLGFLCQYNYPNVYQAFSDCKEKIKNTAQYLLQNTLSCFSCLPHPRNFES